MRNDETTVTFYLPDTELVTGHVFHGGFHLIIMSGSLTVDASTD